MRATCLLLIVVLAITISNAYAQIEWASMPANISIAEFLDLEFRISMERGEYGSLNNYNLVSFYPSDSQERAFVFVIQTWRDNLVTPTNLRQEIRSLADAMFKQFEALINHPTFKKRWQVKNPKNSFIIKHVRYRDLREVLGVTIGDKTYFERGEIKRAESLVRGRGGIWDW